MSTIGERLRDERAQLGMTQEKFASAAGVLRGAQVKYEKDERRPDADYLAAIAAVGADVQYIITGVRAKQPPAPAGLDMARLQLAIETVDEGLQATKRTMASSKKAELVLAVYDMFSDGAESAKEKDRILRVVKSAV